MHVYGYHYNNINQFILIILYSTIWLVIVLSVNTNVYDVYDVYYICNSINTLTKNTIELYIQTHMYTLVLVLAIDQL